jgi:hypothetical protein
MNGSLAFSSAGLRVLNVLLFFLWIFSRGD